MGLNPTQQDRLVDTYDDDVAIAAATEAAAKASDPKQATIMQRVRAGYDHLTQGLNTWTGATKEKNPQDKPAVDVSLGDRQAKLRDVSSSYQQARVIGPGDDLTGAAAAVLQSRAAAPGRVVPVVALGASPGREHLDGTNRPYIQIVRSDRLNALTDGLLGVDISHTYDRFILAGLSESSVEKLDAVETFGAPHVFASGRFIKKLALTGFVRCVPRSASATGSAGDLTLEDLTLPDHVVFRYFYDTYLRATELASRGAIARLYVDGDVYEGFFQNLVYNRDSQMEQVITFQMNMLVLRASNVNDAASARNLERFKDLTPITPQFPDNVAAAHLENALGTTYLSLGTEQPPEYKAGVGFDPTVINGAINAGELKSETDPIPVTSQALYLHMAGAIQGLTVTSVGELRGLTLTGDGKPLDGQATRPGTPYRLGVSVENYNELYTSFQASEDDAPTATFEVRAFDGTKVSVDVSVIVNAKPLVELSEIVLQLGSRAPQTFMPADTSLVIDNVFDILQGNNIQYTVKYRFKSGTVTKVPTQQGFRVSVYPCLATSPATPIKDVPGSPHNDYSFAHAEEPDAAFPAPTATEVLVTGTLTLESGLAGTQQDSPFAYADGIALKFVTPTIGFQNLALKTPVPDILVFARHPDPKASVNEFSFIRLVNPDILFPPTVGGSFVIAVDVISTRPTFLTTPAPSDNPIVRDVYSTLRVRVTAPNLRDRLWLTGASQTLRLPLPGYPNLIGTWGKPILIPSPDPSQPNLTAVRFPLQLTGFPALSPGMQNRLSIDSGQSIFGTGFPATVPILAPAYEAQANIQFTPR